MGVQWFVTFAVAILGICAVRCALGNVERVARKSVTEVCDMKGCNCSDTARTWKIINCTLKSSQTVELTPGSVPAQAMEMSIVGGLELDFNPDTFISMRGFNLLRIDGTKNVFIRSQAFVGLQSNSLLLQIQNCDRLEIENGAFKNMVTPITAEISGCNNVWIQNSAFSRLQDGKFLNVQSLKLSEGAFQFDNQGAIGRHGPATNLSFQSVRLIEIPKMAFASSLAEISFHHSTIDTIHSEAFKASQISAVLFVNSTILRLKTGAFSERTLIYNFVVNRCKIKTIETKAVMAAITNITVQHSSITYIQSEAIISTTANIVINDNVINEMSSSAFVFSNFNRLDMTSNVIKNLNQSFLKLSYDEILEFSFVGNEIYNVYANAFNFLPQLQTQINVNFDDNFFNQVCYCEIEQWLQQLLNDSDVYFVLNTSFCTVNQVLARCFQLQEGLINMQNFTQLVCGDGESISCERYNGETKVLDTTATMLFDEEEPNNTNLILGISLGALLILAFCGTIFILLIRGGIWLKKKGYCIRFRNMRLTQNEISNDDEGAMVDLEQNNKNEQHDVLTPELLLKLRADLENPETHDEAREQIEKLYEQFIVTDSYTNNNRQDEETHLYEELGSLNQNQERNNEINGCMENPINLIKFMEGKFSTTRIDGQPALVGEYSEPTDAAVHLYSELKNKTEEEKTSSIKSNASRMAFRPLPDKPRDNSAPGPSSKY